MSALDGAAVSKRMSEGERRLVNIAGMFLADRARAGQFFAVGDVVLVGDREVLAALLGLELTAGPLTVIVGRVAEIATRVRASGAACADADPEARERAARREHAAAQVVEGAAFLQLALVTERGLSLLRLDPVAHMTMAVSARGGDA